MVWMVRRGLSPIYELAREKRIGIHSNDWHFDAPQAQKRRRRIGPLATALEAALARLERSFQTTKTVYQRCSHELKTDVADYQVIVATALIAPQTHSRRVYPRLSLSLDDFTRWS